MKLISAMFAHRNIAEIDCIDSLLSQRRVREDLDFSRSKSPSSPLIRMRGNHTNLLMSRKSFIGCRFRYLDCHSDSFRPIGCTPLLSAQSKPLKEIRVPYALGGSTGFFWVAQRSGSFEKYGIKVLPIFMRGGREAVQALISRDVMMLQQGSSGVILAWAQGAKDLVVLGATGNKLDYVFVSNPNIKKPEDLKGKKVAISQLGASTDFIARLAVRQLGLNEKDVTLLSIGAQGERWAALAAGHVDASVFQPPITLRAAKPACPSGSIFPKATTNTSSPDRSHCAHSSNQIATP